MKLLEPFLVRHRVRTNESDVFVSVVAKLAHAILGN
jgi:hypothetical protein